MLLPAVVEDLSAVSAVHETLNVARGCHVEEDLVN